MKLDVVDPKVISKTVDPEKLGATQAALADLVEHVLRSPDKHRFAIVQRLAKIGVALAREGAASVDDFYEGEDDEENGIAYPRRRRMRAAFHDGAQNERDQLMGFQGMLEKASGWNQARSDADRAQELNDLYELRDRMKRKKEDAARVQARIDVLLSQLNPIVLDDNKEKEKCSGTSQLSTETSASAPRATENGASSRPTT